MLDLSWTELLVVAVIAIIVVGPKDLPRALRGIGRWTGKAKRMAREFQNQFNEALREAELDTIKKEVDAVGKLDPMGDMREDMREIESGLKSATKPKPARKPAKKPAEDSEMKEIAADKGTDEPAPHPPTEATPPAAATSSADAKS